MLGKNNYMGGPGHPIPPGGPGRPIPIPPSPPPPSPPPRIR